MAHVCGIHLRVLALCAALAVLGLTAGAARADNAAPSPQPQNLWHAYPLDNGSRSPAAPRATRAAARTSSTDSGRSTVLLWVAVAAFGAAAAAFAVSRRRSGRPWPLPGRLSHQHLVLAADGAPVEAEPVAAPSPPRPPPQKLRSQEAKTLKEKKRRTPPAKSKDDVSVLRAKLAASPPSKPASVAAPVRLQPVPATRCHIGWWRGYVKSEFQAYSAPRERERAVVATSPPFRWSKAEPPPEDLAEAVSAHAALRRELEAAGWVATGTRGRWFAIEFERLPNGGGRGKADHEQ
jgi:hypothetical protein